MTPGHPPHPQLTKGPPSGGPLHRGLAALSSACSTSATRSSVSSQPAEKRMKPSGTSSVPQRARRSAVECTPPKLVASLTSSQASRKAWACSAGRERQSEMTGPTPGPADAGHVVAAVERVRQRARVRLRALQPQAERGQRAMGEPCLERSEDCCPSATASHELLGQRRVADADRAEQHVRVPGQRLGAREHREVGAVVERPEAERRGDRVVDRQQRPAACAAATTASRSQTSSARVGGRLDPHERRAVGGGDDRLGVGRHHPDLDALRLEVRRRELADAGVAVAARDEHVAGAQPREHDRGHGGHARGEDDGLAAVELAERALEVPSRSGWRRARSRTAPSPGRRAGGTGAARTGPGSSGSPCSAGGRPACTARVLGPRRLWRFVAHAP